MLSAVSTGIHHIFDPEREGATDNGGWKINSYNSYISYVETLTNQISAPNLRSCDLDIITVTGVQHTSNWQLHSV